MNDTLLKKLLINSFNKCLKAVEKIGFWHGCVTAFLLILPH